MSNQTNVYENPRLYLRSWFQKKGFIVDEQGRVKKIDGSHIGLSSIFDSMNLDYDSEVKNYNNCRPRNSPALRRVSKELLEDALNEYKREVRDDILKQKVADLSHDSNLNFNDLEKFIKACTGKIQQDDFSPDLVAIAHWIWMVKRRMTGKSVSNHLMPLFHGKQGCGKTVAINKLTELLCGFRQAIQVSSVADERYNLMWEENFIAVCDEMQGTARTDVDSLKNIITGSERATRKFHTQIVDKVPIRCSFIGSTNKHIQELIADDSGLRRFHVIECLDRIDWDIVNSIDYVKLWKSIDETKEDGYYDKAASVLQAKQEENRVKNSVELFVDECQIVGRNMSKEKRKIDVYSSYKNWCETYGHRPLNDAAFGRKLKPLGVKDIRRTIGNRKDRFYLLDVDSELFVRGAHLVD